MFASGLQCAKRLYLDYHHPDEMPASPAQRSALLDAGLRLLEIARQAFPNGRRVDAEDFDLAVEQTRAMLADGKPMPIFDAAFRHDGVQVRTDIVFPTGSGKLDVFEVKAGTKVKTRHIKDLAFQLHAIEGSGHEVGTITVLRLKSTYKHAGGTTYPVLDLLKHVDVTEKVRNAAPKITDQITAFQNVLDDPLTLDLPTGTWCHTPFTCGYLPRCHAEGTEHPLVDFPDLTREQENALHQQGIEDITQIDAEQIELTAVQQRALQAVLDQQLVVEDFVGRELEDVEYPLHFLDIGSALQVLPTLPQMSPWQHLPFRWTDAVMNEDGRIDVVSFVGNGKDDPRAEFVRQLASHLDGQGTLMLWGEHAEQCLRELLDALPEQKSEIRQILSAARFDLQELVRAGVYHPDFRGSFALQVVHDTLTGDATCPDLEADAEAVAAYDKMATPRTRATTRQKLADDLQAWGEARSHALSAVYRSLLAQTARP